MKRRFINYRTSERFHNRHVCIDEQCADEILTFLENDPKIQEKFDYIVNRILEQRNIYYDDYQSIGKDVSEMRIFPNGKNARIYCKEVKTESGHFYIVAAKLLEKKKDNKINKKNKNLIEPIIKYEYDI